MSPPRPAWSSVLRVRPVGSRLLGDAVSCFRNNDFCVLHPSGVLDEVVKCIVIAGGMELAVVSQLIVSCCFRLWVNDLYVTEALQGVRDSDSTY